MFQKHTVIPAKIKAIFTMRGWNPLKYGYYLLSFILNIGFAYAEPISNIKHTASDSFTESFIFIPQAKKEPTLDLDAKPISYLANANSKLEPTDSVIKNKESKNNNGLKVTDNDPLEFLTTPFKYNVFIDDTTVRLYGRY